MHVLSTVARVLHANWSYFLLTEETRAKVRRQNATPLVISMFAAAKADGSCGVFFLTPSDLPYILELWPRAMG